MQHIEEAGIHSGDSSCVLPPYSPHVAAKLDVIRDYTHRLAKALNVRGLMNVQYAIKEETVYVLEVNPRASRTVPFVSKATGVPLARLAAKIMVGRTLAELGLLEEPRIKGRFVKASVFPFTKFPGDDPVLGPEMRSTGEVMGFADDFGAAFAKASYGAGLRLPLEGTAFVTVNDRDKPQLLPLARALVAMDFRLVATDGTAAFLRANDLPCDHVFKVLEGRPNAVDLMKNGEIHLVINTPLGKASYFDEKALRTTATQRGIPLITTLSAGHAMVEAIRALRRGALTVKSLQEVYA
jgi:carbamoyl-phosphate synthase large subunit